MDFETIPGVGEKTAAALAELDDAERASTDGDVAALARAPGFTERRAAAIVHGVIRHDYDGLGGFLATDRASEIYRDAFGLLQAWTVTMYTEKRLETLFPTGSAPRIEEVWAFVVDVTDLDLDPDVLAALSGVESLVDPTPCRVREYCIAIADAERYVAAKEAFPELSIEIIEDGRDIVEFARSYSTVAVLDESFASTDMDGDVRVLPDAVKRTDEVIPERLLVLFVTNRKAPEAAAAVHEVVELDPPCDLVALRDTLPRLADNGTVLGGDEPERLSNAVDDLDTAVSTAESAANGRLRDVIHGRDVAIERTDLLSPVEQGACVDPLLSREPEDEFDETFSAARDHSVESLSLRSGEVDFTKRAFPDDPSFPLGHDEEAVGHLQTELKAVRDRRAAKLEAGLAADLGDLRDPVETLVRDAFELDARLAASRFVRDLGCVFPELTGTAGDDGADSLAVGAGRPLLPDVDFSDVDLVDYRVLGVMLLLGVNSGGKILTLDLVGLAVVLAHMRLPVPIESVRLLWFPELYHHAKSQGTFDAGAFESTLRDFVALTDGAADRLVPVDELESTTEPGALAKIITGIPEELAEQGAAAVFVSHLANGIRKMTDVSVTADGTEAVGLGDGELAVNRSPVKDHLVRLTPELIVEKLAGESEASFYG